MSNLGNRILVAAKWSVFSELLSKIILPVTSMILARIISPEAFGIVATVSMIFSFADMLTEAGFQKYLIHKNSSSQKDLFEYADAGFWTNLALSVLILFFVVMFRQSIAGFFGGAYLENAILVSFLQLPITSLTCIQYAILRRNFEYRSLFITKMVTVIVPLFVTIPLAMLGLGYWSIIIGNLASQFLSAIFLTRFSNWKPRFSFVYSRLMEMIHFCSYSTIEQILVWLTSWFDIFIIASSFSQYYIGIYKTSTLMVNSLMAIITGAVVPILFSALSRLQNEESRFRDLYLKSQKIASIFLIPLGAGIYLFRDLAVNIFLGERWIEASNVIGIWALTSSIVIVFSNLNSEVYRAKGKPAVSLTSQLIHLAFLVPACIIGSQYGFWAFVYIRSWMRVVLVIPSLMILSRFLEIGIIVILKNVLSAIVSTMIMSAICIFMVHINSGVLWDIITIVVCILIYFISLYQFSDTRDTVKLLVVGFLRTLRIIV